MIFKYLGYKKISIYILVMIEIVKNILISLVIVYIFKNMSNK